MGSMEQALMFGKSRSWNLETERSNFKKPLQITLFLVVCIWLMYQMKHQDDDPRSSYGGNVNTHDRLTLLGRKGTAGFVIGAMTGSNESGFGLGDVEVEGSDFDEKSEEMVSNGSGNVNSDGEEAHETHRGEEKTSEMGDMGNGIYGFQDENGVPPDWL